MCGKMAMSASPSGGGHDFWGTKTGFLSRTVRQTEVARCNSTILQGAT